MLSSAELTISSLNLCHTLLPLSCKCRQLHKCFFSTEHRVCSSQLVAPSQRNMLSGYQAHLPYAGILESPELSDNSQVDRKKSLVRLDSDNTVPGHRPIVAIPLSLNRRRMPECAWCCRVRLWKVSLAFINWFFFYAYSNGKTLTVGHSPMGQLLLGHEGDVRELVSDSAHVAMWWTMMSFLSVIPSSRFTSSQSRAATCVGQKMDFLSFVLMAGIDFLTFGFIEAMCGTVLRICLLSFTAIDMTWPILTPLPQRDSTAISVPLRHLEPRWEWCSRKNRLALPWYCYKSLWFNYHQCNQFFRLVYALQHP